MSLLTSFLMMMDLSKEVTHFTWPIDCQHPSSYSLYKMVVHITLVILIYLIPFILITVTYVKIFLVAKGNSVRTRRNSLSSLRCNSLSSLNGKTILTVNIKNKASLCRSPSSNSTGQELLTALNNLRSSMKTRASNMSSLVLDREERRAAGVTGLVVVVVFLCWGPYVSSILLLTILHTPPWLHTLSLTILLSFTVISPLLYSLRSKVVRTKVRTMLGIPPTLATTHRGVSLSCPQLVLMPCPSLHQRGDLNGGSLLCKNSSSSMSDMQNLLAVPSTPRQVDQAMDTDPLYNNMDVCL